MGFCGVDGSRKPLLLPQTVGHRAPAPKGHGATDNEKGR